MISCSTREPNQPTDGLPDKASQSTSQTFRTIPDDSLLHYAYKTEKPKESNLKIDFQTLEDFPNSWVGLSKNAIGYFIYHRGKGTADNLTILNDTLRNGGYGETVSCPIREFKQVSLTKCYFGLGSDTTSATYARCTIEILDSDTLYAIQSTRVYTSTDTAEKLLGEYSGLYVPTFQQHLFYHIEEPNRKDPSAWIPREEMDLEEFKNIKLAK